MASQGRLDFDMVGIATALSTKEFRVPIYQRSYAWKESELQDFWDDLKQALDSGDADYFLGTVVLTPDEGNSRRLVIIDGQQRLATTTLLLTALRDVWTEAGRDSQATHIDATYLATFNRRSDVAEPRLIMNEEDDPFFRKLIVASEAPEAGDTVERRSTDRKESHDRLEDALAFLKTQLSDDSASFGDRAEDRLIAWADFLDDSAKVIAVEVPTEADAFVIFETLNDRGASLTIGDLLKNYLFMKAGDRLETVKTAWIQALNELDASAENDEFIAFLRHNWSSRHGAVRERDLYRDIKTHVRTPAEAAKHADELVDAAGLYAALLSPSDDYWHKPEFTSTTRDNVASLVRLDLEQNRPLLLAVLAMFTFAEQKRALQALVSWSVRGLIVGGIGGGRNEKAYCTAAVRIREGKIKTTVELLEELSSIVPEDDVFEDEFSRASQTPGATARYFQLALQRAETGETEPELVPNANEDEVNLEHVLPRRAKQEDWPAFEPDDVSKWANRVGNHCLLKKTENGKIGNKAWSVKKPILTSSTLSLTSEVGASTDWTQAEIVARQKKLAKLAVTTWPRDPR